MAEQPPPPPGGQRAQGDENIQIQGNDNRVEQRTVQYQAVFRPLEPPDDATVAAARARLTELPLDIVPYVTTLPSGSRMPFTPNPLFVGRQDDLRALARAIAGGQPAAITTGIGGAGKTQLAAEFVHRYGRYFAGGVFWLSFADEKAVPAEIAACGGAGGMELRPDFADLPLSDQTRSVQAAWSWELPRLLVFDNCEQPELLARWRPTTGGCRLLVTSRVGSWPPVMGVQALPLGVLNREESIDLLRRTMGDDSVEEGMLGDIAEEVGRLPLALHLAGSFLGEYRHDVTPAAYLEQLRSPELLRHQSMQPAAGYSPTGHQLSVARTFALSHDRLLPGNATGDLARALLARAACFAPGEPLPRDLLLATVTGDGDGADETLTRGAALRRLVALGLLEEETDGAVRLHRLVAMFVQGTAPVPAARPAVEAVMLERMDQVNSSGLIAPLLPVQRHLRAVTDAAIARDDEAAVRLCNRLGYHMHLSGDLAGARRYYECALAIAERVLGADHPFTATNLNNLGSLLRATGDLAGARPYVERALAMRERLLGPDHPLTAQSLNNLAVLLEEGFSAYEGSRRLKERALAIRERVLGPDHPDTATSLNNLGSLLQAAGDLTGARPYYERALAIRERVLGPDHPDTATSLNNLGFLLHARGDLTGARPYYERALDIVERALGGEHPTTRTIRGNLRSLDE